MGAYVFSGDDWPGTMAWPMPGAWPELNGAIYLAQQLNGDVVQVNPNGTFNQVIVGGINQATGLLADTFNDSLYVSSAVYGNGTVYNVKPDHEDEDSLCQRPSGWPDFVPPTAPSCTGPVTKAPTMGMSWASAPRPTRRSSTPASSPVDTHGSALGTGFLTGNLFVNTNGGSLFEVNLATLAQTQLATGGSAGRLRVGGPQWHAAADSDRPPRPADAEAGRWFCGRECRAGTL